MIFLPQRTPQANPDSFSQASSLAIFHRNDHRNNEADDLKTGPRGKSREPDEGCHAAGTGLR
jgi:hypothetical protein